jgi:Transposase DDE domain
MRQYNRNLQAKQMAFVRNQFAQVEGLPFSNVLTATTVMQALQAAGVVENEHVYTSTILLWMFLSQVLDADHSCRATVARLVAHKAGQGEKIPSAETGAYCQARKRMPESVFAECVRQTGRAMEAEAGEDWKWFGHDVKIADGTTCSMPDTHANQIDYPQPDSQKPGVGFPLMRVLAVFSLATGLVLDLRFSRYAGKFQSELGMLRQLWDQFAAGDVALTDRYLCSWFEIATLQQQGTFVAMRLHHGRNADFRRGKRLGRNDHVVEWIKPAQCPDWMDKETYAAMPKTLKMREIRVRIDDPGCRTEEVIVVTNLLDAEKYTAGVIAGLYRARWYAETDLRSLKTTMQMDVLRGKTPDIVRKEIWVHALAYNLIRTVIAQAARRFNVLPRTISFKGTLQTLLAFQPQFAAASPADLPRLVEELWRAIIVHRVGDRPDRNEPRAKKRRPKSYPLLTQPRHEARIALCRKK